MTDSDSVAIKRMKSLIDDSRVYEEAYSAGDKHAACELLSVSREILNLIDGLERVTPPAGLRQRWVESIESVSLWLEQQYG